MNDITVLLERYFKAFGHSGSVRTSLENVWNLRGTSDVRRTILMHDAYRSVSRTICLRKINCHSEWPCKRTKNLEILTSSLTVIRSRTRNSSANETAKKSSDRSNDNATSRDGRGNTGRPGQQRTPDVPANPEGGRSAPVPDLSGGPDSGGGVSQATHGQGNGNGNSRAHGKDRNGAETTMETDASGSQDESESDDDDDDLDSYISEDDDSRANASAAGWDDDGSEVRPVPVRSPTIFFLLFSLFSCLFRFCSLFCIFFPFVSSFCSCVFCWFALSVLVVFDSCCSSFFGGSLVIVFVLLLLFRVIIGTERRHGSGVTFHMILDPI